MSNPFDQFDAESGSGNPFDQFDAESGSGNPFDRFDVKPDKGAVAAAVRGGADSLSFGLSDRLSAGIGAGVDAITGKGFDYSDRLADQQQMTRQAFRQHPAAFIGGQLAGGLGMPVGAVARGATLGARALGGAVAGGLQGAAYGAGSSQDLTNVQDVSRNALTGAAIGGSLGGVGVPAIEGAVGAAKVLGRPLGNAVRGIRNPGAEADRQIGMSLQEDSSAASRPSIDGEPRNPLMTTQEMAAVRGAGQPAVIGDLGGPGTRRLARKASNISPQAQQALQSVTGPRFEQQSERVSQFVSHRGGGNAVSTLEGLNDDYIRSAKPLYDAAHKAGADGIWNDDIGRLMEAPAVADAVKDSIKTGSNWDVAHGHKPVKAPFTVSDDGTVMPKTNADGSIVRPSLQFWDHVKRSLDKEVSTKIRAGDPTAGTVKSLKNQLLGHLDAAVPEYKKARGVAAEYFGSENALEAGRKFFHARGENAEFKRVIAKMTDPERKLFWHGLASEAAAHISEASDNRNVLNSLFNSRAARERFEMAGGKEEADALAAMLHTEKTMNYLHTAVGGNSTSAQQLSDMGVSFPHSIGTMFAALARHVGLGVNEKVAAMIGEKLASSNPRHHENALKMVAGNKMIDQFIQSISPKMVAAVLPGVMFQLRGWKTTPVPKRGYVRRPEPIEPKTGPRNEDSLDLR